MWNMFIRSESQQKQQEAAGECASQSGNNMPPKPDSSRKRREKKGRRRREGRPNGIFIYCKKLEKDDSVHNQRKLFVCGRTGAGAESLSIDKEFGHEWKCKWFARLLDGQQTIRILFLRLFCIFIMDCAFCVAIWMTIKLRANGGAAEVHQIKVDHGGLSSFSRWIYGISNWVF